jgi:hypothetical protein
MGGFMELQQIISDYKQAVIEYEAMSKKKDYLKEALLQIVSYKEGTYGDIVIAKYRPASIVEWKSIVIELSIDPKVIERYTVHKADSLRVSIKRVIAPQP